MECPCPFPPSPMRRMYGALPFLEHVSVFHDIIKLMIRRVWGRVLGLKRPTWGNKVTSKGPEHPTRRPCLTALLVNLTLPL
jgi:hypothetical protein